MESSTNNPTRGRKRRGVVILIALAIVWLAIRWFQTNAPENIGSVGKPPELADDIIAVVTLIRPTEKVISAQIVDSYNLNKAHRTLVIRSNGLIESVSDNERASVIERFSRARFWFMPNFIGTLSVQSKTTHGTFPVFKRKRLITANVMSKREVIASPWPSAVFGAHVSCPSECDNLPHNFAGLRESGLSFDVISRSPSSISLVFDAKTDIDSIVRIISLLVARQNPEPQSVQLPDKTVYSTLIPNSSVKIESETFGTFPITLIKSGDIVWTILHHKDSTIVTNDGKLLTEWLSTPLLTKKVCGKRPIWFYRFQTIEPWPSFISVGQSQKELFACIE